MALNPFQKAIEQLALSIGLKGQAQQGVYSSPQFQDLINQFFGEIPLPAGVDPSMVVSKTPTSVEYRDAQGYVHRLERDISGVSPRLGQVQETSTNRPSVLPLQQSGPESQVFNMAFGNPQGNGEFYGLPSTPVNPNIQQQPQNLAQTLNNALANPVALSQLDPTTQAQLQQIFNAQNAIQEDSFNKAQGTAVAQLVGNGVGASSIAGQIMNQLLQGQGLVRGQNQANQNQALIGLQQFLTGADQQKNQNLQQFIQFLLGQGTERDIAGANIDTQRTQIGNQNDQFYNSLQEQIRQFDEQQRMQERQAMIGNIFKGIATATGVASGLGGLNFGSLFGKGFNYGNAGKPPSDLGYG